MITGLAAVEIWIDVPLSVKLTPDEEKALEEPYVPHPVLGFS